MRTIERTKARRYREMKFDDKYNIPKLARFKRKTNDRSFASSPFFLLDFLLILLRRFISFILVLFHCFLVLHLLFTHLLLLIIIIIIIIIITITIPKSQFLQIFQSICSLYNSCEYMFAMKQILKQPVINGFPKLTTVATRSMITHRRLIYC